MPVCACVRVRVFMREKVTVEIQIHEHSSIVSLWDFFACFFFEHRRSDRLENIQNSSPQ